MIKYLQGHEPFMKGTIASDLIGLPVIDGNNQPSACPVCGFEPMCYHGGRHSNYAKRTCNNPECNAEFAVYHDGMRESHFTHLRIRNSQFGRPLPHTHIIHQGGNGLWHIPLYGINDRGYYQNWDGEQMIEIWVDQEGNLYLPSKNPEIIEA